MKAFVAYDESGRVTGVGIPNPELGDHIVMEATGDNSIVTIDCSEIVKGAGQLTFATSGEGADRLQEVVRTIVERYRVDPVARRLVSKEASAKGS
jgi:hypothetical protein